MNIADVIILLMLGLGAVIGFKRGFFRQTVMTVGSILVIVLAFSLKNPVSVFLYEHLPFFNWSGVFAGVTTINILIYEVVAFVIVASILFVILRLLLGLTSLIEKVADMTIILGLISRILGAILGVIEAYICLFIVLYILTLPIINFKFLNESHYKNKILTKTPIVSKIANDTVKTFNDIYALRNEAANPTKLNQDALCIMLKNKVVTVESVTKLKESGKLRVSGIDNIISRCK